MRVVIDFQEEKKRRGSNSEKLPLNKIEKISEDRKDKIEEEIKVLLRSASQIKLLLSLE